MTWPDDNRLIEAALARRGNLISGGITTAYRILNGAADGTEGLVIERFGPALIVQWHEGRTHWPLDRVRSMAGHVHEKLGTTGVYLKHFVRDRAAASADDDQRHHEPTPWIGKRVDSEVMVDEHGLRFLVRPFDGFSIGLFLEHRDNRRMIRELATGKRVLNLFAYTCGFSVAAAAGGAAHVASVDLSKRYLEWGRRNFTANDLSTENAKFYASDTFDFYRRAERQRLEFDLIILDPPTFSRTRRPARVFELATDLDRLLAGAVRLLSPCGRLFFSTNFRQLAIPVIEAALHTAAASQTGSRPPRRIRVEKRPVLPADFAGDRDYAKSILARVD